MSNSGITVTNNGTNSVTIDSQVIAGSGGVFTFLAANAAVVCQSIALREGFLNSTLTVAISGTTLDPTQSGCEDLLDQIVAGSITVV